MHCMDVVHGRGTWYVVRGTWYVVRGTLYVDVVRTDRPRLGFAAEEHGDGAEDVVHAAVWLRRHAGLHDARQNQHHVVIHGDATWVRVVRLVQKQQQILILNDGAQHLESVAAQPRRHLPFQALEQRGEENLALGGEHAVKLAYDGAHGAKHEAALGDLRGVSFQQGPSPSLALVALFALDCQSLTELRNKTRVLSCHM